MGTSGGADVQISGGGVSDALMFTRNLSNVSCLDEFGVARLRRFKMGGVGAILRKCEEGLIILGEASEDSFLGSNRRAVGMARIFMMGVSDGMESPGRREDVGVDDVTFDLFSKVTLGDCVIFDFSRSGAEESASFEIRIGGPVLFFGAGIYSTSSSSSSSSSSE